MEATTSTNAENIDYSAANAAKSKYCELFKMLGNGLRLEF